jgi:hypothetical protein
VKSNIEHVRQIDHHRALYKVPCSEPGCTEVSEIILTADQAKEFEAGNAKNYCFHHNKFPGDR